MKSPFRLYREAVYRRDLLTAALQNLNSTLVAMRVSTDNQTRQIAALSADLAAIRTSASVLEALEVTREKRGNYGHLVA
jgi:hypothetical protein